MEMEQKVLQRSALDAFDTPEGVVEQLRHFKECYGYDRSSPFSLLDVGGGAGYFVSALQEEFPAMRATILDIDESAVFKARGRGLAAEPGSILERLPEHIPGEFDVICFNLVLHHIVAGGARKTRELQMRALSLAGKRLSGNGSVFVHEICYEGRIFPDSTGAMIFQALSNPLFAGIARLAGRFVPSLRANTVGVGVRFRPSSGWVRLIEEAGGKSLKVRPGGTEGHSLSRRLLLNVREVRRCSFKAQW